MLEVKSLTDMDAYRLETLRVIFESAFMRGANFAMRSAIETVYGSR